MDGSAKSRGASGPSRRPLRLGPLDVRAIFEVAREKMASLVEQAPASRVCLWLPVFAPEDDPLEEKLGVGGPSHPT